VKLKVFSMFSGIGGFEVGLQNSNLEHELIGYSEIDKYAIEIFERHFKGVKNYGNATNIQGDELPDFDLLVGGFPCQAFSVAGLQRGFNDTRGTLFFDIARICSEKRPRYLVLENVKGLLSHDNGKTFQTILRVLTDMGYRVEWQVLNSKDWGVPQNRERIFIIGYLRNFPTRKIFPIIGSEGQAPSRESKEKPRHLKIDKKGNIKKNPNTASTITGGAHSGGNHSDMDLLVTPVLTPDRAVKRQNGRRFKEPGDESFTLTGQDIHGVMLSKPKLNEITSEVDHLLKEFKTFYARKYEVNQAEICDYLNKWRKESEYTISDLDAVFGYAHTAGHWFRKDSSGSIPTPEDWRKLKKILAFDDTYDEQVTTLEEREITYEQSLRVYDTSLSKTLTSTEDGGLYRVSSTAIRRLTPTECERLQGFSDGWTFDLSDTQRYKTLGNAVTTNVITMLMNKLAERI
jgi:DNA (cytosine-5)-methyltransferase 1